jgi:hypothetical protein
MKIVARSFLLLLISAAMSGAATADSAATFSAVLTYPPVSGSSEASRVFHSHGKAYRFRLDPERNGYGTLFGFELILERANHSRPEPNLLDPTGKLHGYQKWDFLASEFAHDHAPPGWGSSRTIYVPNRGLEVQVQVVRFGVRHAPTSLAPLGYRFTDLTLRVVARSTAVRP